MRINTSPVQRLARNFIIINGKNSRAVKGLLVQELPAITKPAMRTDDATIDGRDGEIVTKLGYEAYDKEVKIGLHGEFDIDEVISFFATDGEIIFSNEPDKKYRFAQYEGIDFDRLGRFRTATVSFRVQPFKYSAVDESLTVQTPGHVSFVPQSITRNGLTATASGRSIRITGTAKELTTILFQTEFLRFSGTGTAQITVISADMTGGCSFRLIRGIIPTNANTFGGMETILTLGVNDITGTRGGSYDHVYLTIQPGATDVSLMVENPDAFSNIDIDNKGNTTAKPTITVTGSGEFEIRLNRELISTITIPTGKTGVLLDVEEMRAVWFDSYGRESGTALRGIVGDFTRLILHPGENLLGLDSVGGGIITAEIKNFSRWL
jgi:predicted phage tail component-like protein